MLLYSTYSSMIYPCDSLPLFINKTERSSMYLARRTHTRTSAHRTARTWEVYGRLHCAKTRFANVSAPALLRFFE